MAFPFKRPVSCCGEEALGNDNVEINGQTNRPHGNSQDHALVFEDPSEAAGIGFVKGLKSTLAGVIEAIVLLPFLVGFEQLGAHRRRGRERDDHGDGHSRAEGDGELAEHAADNAAHQENGDENGDKRGTHGQHGEADFAGTFESGFERRHALFEIAGDVFDDHDGVVHDEAGGDGQGHQGEVIDGVAGQDT